MGFSRDGKWWSRTVGTLLERVDLQTSQFAGTTANLWSKDLATEKLLCEAIPWKRPMGIVEFGVRIGNLMGGKDKWWRNDPNGPAELAGAMQTHAPAFFESRRSLENQALGFGRHDDKWRNSATRIYLALTLYRMGEVEEACAALQNPANRLSPEWLAEVESVRKWLGCGGASLP
jgi:hypothetical protein